MTLYSNDSQFERSMDQPFFCPDCGMITETKAAHGSVSIEICKPCDWEMVVTITPTTENASDRGPGG